MGTPEVVNAGTPVDDPAHPLLTRYWAEGDPRKGELRLYEIHPGNIIYRESEVSLDQFGLRYNETGTAMQDSCMPSTTCIPTAGRVRIATPAGTVTFVDGSSTCTSGGGVCDGVFPRAPAPVSAPCAESNTFCADIQMVSRHSAPLTNVVLRIANEGVGASACGTPAAAPIIGCQPQSTVATHGLCKFSSGNGPNKADDVVNSTLTSCVTGDGATTHPCSYCFGNTATIDNSYPGLVSLKGAVMPNLSGATVDADLRTINTVKVALKLTGSASFKTVLEVRYGTPGLPAAGQFSITMPGAGSCVTPGTSTVIVNGGSFGPPAACFGAQPLASCPLSDIVSTSPPAAGFSVSVEGVPVAAGDYRRWSDRAVGFIMPMGSSGSNLHATVTTPLGSVTTTNTFNICTGGPNTWRTLAGGTISAIQPVAGVFGTSIVVAGGRGDASDPTSTLGATRYFTAPAAGAGITVSNGMDMTTPRWGAAFATVGGKLYAIGGSEGFSCLVSTESLSMAAGAWTDEGADLPTGICQGTAVAVGNLIFLTGGTQTPNPDQGLSAPPNTNTCVLDTGNIAGGWDCTTYTAGNDIAVTARVNGAAASTGTVGLITGGVSLGSAVLSAVEQVTAPGGDPAFAAGTVLPAAKNLPGLTSANNFFYVMGGSASASETGAGTATLHRTDNTTPGAWAAMTSAPTARMGHVLLAAQCGTCPAQKVFAIGGNDGGTLRSTIEEYTE